MALELAMYQDDGPGYVIDLTEDGRPLVVASIVFSLILMAPAPRSEDPGSATLGCSLVITDIEGNTRTFDDRRPSRLNVEVA